jgi:mRNA interferase RelE/StbE
MHYQVEYTQRAIDDLADLPRVIAKRIYKKINWFAVQTKPLNFAKALNNFELGKYRFRIGDYRIVFDVDVTGTVTILMILRIKHRKEVYDL